MLGRDITDEVLLVADNAIVDFCKRLEELYGVTSVTMNVHQLRHLSFHVRNFGPLWAYSCFGFESRNGDIKKLFHGSRNTSQQVHYNYIVLQTLPTLSAVDCMNPVVKDLMARMGSTRDIKSVFKHRKVISDDPKVWQIGPSRRVRNEDVTLGASTVNQFYRIQVGRSTYSCKYYTRSSLRNYTVLYINNDGERCCGEIQYFFANDHSAYAVVKPLTMCDLPFAKYVHLRLKGPDHQESANCLVDVTNIVCKCITATVGANVYISVYPHEVIPVIDL